MALGLGDVSYEVSDRPPTMVATLSVMNLSDMSADFVTISGAVRAVARRRSAVGDRASKPEPLGMGKRMAWHSDGDGGWGGAGGAGAVLEQRM